MATRPRLTVPPLPPPSIEPPAAPDPLQLEPGFEMDEHLRHLRDTGDLAVLTDARFADWQWNIFRMRSAEERRVENAKNPRILVDKQTGPLDLMEIQRLHGGGLYEIWGRDPDGVLRFRYTQEIAGARKNYNAMPSHVNGPAPSASGVNSATEQRIMQLLEQQQQLLAALVNRPEPRSDTKQVVELATTIAGMTNGKTQLSSSEVLETLREGMRLQAQVSEGPKPSAAETIVDKVLPVAERVLATMFRQRPPMRPARAATGAASVSGSSATVVPETPATPSPVTESQETDAVDNYRILAAVDACARAIATGVDAESFAASLEDILDPQEIALLRASSSSGVLDMLRQHAAGRFPILETEQAAVFVGRVLAELNATPDAQV